MLRTSFGTFAHEQIPLKDVIRNIWPQHLGESLLFHQQIAKKGSFIISQQMNNPTYMLVLLYTFLRKIVSQLQEKLTYLLNLIRSPWNAFSGWWVPAGKCGYEQMPRLLYILYRSLIVVLLVKKPWQAHLVVLHSFWAVWSHYRVKSSTVRLGGRECVNISITLKRLGFFMTAVEVPEQCQAESQLGLQLLMYGVLKKCWGFILSMIADAYYTHISFPDAQEGV